MSSNRKRRVSLVTTDTPDDVSLLTSTGGNFEQKLMTRASKRRKMALSTNTMTEESTDAIKLGDTQKLVIGEGQTVNKQSTRVKRQAWTSTGIGVFFEALAEHGKDFGKILSYMRAKAKKRKQRDPFIENLTKNQVRFFYYRTWHKVSSLLALGERDEGSPCSNQKRLPKIQVSVPSSEVVKVCGSDEETEGETEGVFDMSLDEGEDSQDGCSEQLPTASIVIPEDGDSMPCSGSHYGNPSSFKSDVTEPSFDHLPSDKEVLDTIGEESCNDLIENEVERNDNMTGGSSHGGNIGDTVVIAVGDTGGDSGAVGVVSGDGRDVVEIGKQDKKKGESGGGMVKVNGAWQSLDLVAMICYSKMNHKFRADKEVLGRKLNELVYNGTTNIRIKGKRRKEVKIPNCPALKSNKGSASDAGAIECSSAPCESALTFELQPLNSATWSYVQQLSMNPRLRLSLSPTRTIKELFHLIATKWHILPKEVFNVLKLYNTQQQRLQSTNTTESQDGTRHTQPNALLQCASENDGTLLQPLQLEPSMTLMELTMKLYGTTRRRQKVSLHYQIMNQKTNTAERNLDHLMKLAIFLTSSYKPPPTPNAPIEPTSPTTPPSSITTPTHRLSATPSSSSLISSPVVIQYMKSLPKKSPIKSPLTKYKRMKHLRPSPLKGKQSATVIHRIKPIQLQFPPVQGKSPTATESSSNRRSLPQNATAKNKTQSGKEKDQSKKTPHLVTISKNCLAQSGSFTGLRLDDLFQSVSNNFKGIQSKFTDKPQKVSSVSVVPLHESKAVESVGEEQHRAIIATTATEVLSPTITVARHDQAPPPSSHLIKASPLERLASEVSASTQLLQHSQQSAASSNYQINITATGVSTTKPLAIASPTSRPITSTSTKPVKRNPNSQRPVVPKPLIYLPQFTKQLASLQIPHPAQLLSNKQQKNTTTSIPTTTTTQTSLTTPVVRSTPTNPVGVALHPPVQAALNTQELLQAQVSLLQELLTKPASQNREDEHKRQQAVQTLLQSLITLGSQYPALLQKLDLKALLSAAVQSKRSGNQSELESSTGKSQETLLDSTNVATTDNPVLATDQSIPSSDANIVLLSSFPVLNSPIITGPEPIHASSDTVSELLKGLSPNEDLINKDSVMKLSQETADVLPNFARAMMHLRTETNHYNTIGQLPSISGSSDSSGSTDLLTLLQAENSEFNPINDTSFKSIVDSTDYTDVFAQLKDILSTPERPSVSRSVRIDHEDRSDLGVSSSQNKSSGEILDIFNSPFKTQQTLSEHGLRSMLEENSVDYINKFKELASSMDNTS